MTLLGSRPVRRPRRLGPHAQPEGDVLEDRHVREQRVVLEHEAHLALAHVGVGRVLAVEQHAARIGHLQPGDDAQQRRLARARGPEQRHQLAGRDVEVQVVADDGGAEALVEVADFDRSWSFAPFAAPRASAPSRAARPRTSAPASPAPAAPAARPPRRRRRTGTRCRGSRCAAACVLVWPRMWPETTLTAPNSPIARALHRITPYSSAHFTLGIVTRQKICQPPAPSTRAASSCSLPCACISGISSRATKGKVTNTVASTMPGHREDHLQVVVAQPFAEPALQAEHQHVDQAGDHRAHRERQVDQRQQHVLAAEVELGDAPGRGHAEHQVHRHADAGGDQRELDGGERIGLDDRRQVHVPRPSSAPRRTPIASGTNRKSGEKRPAPRR